MSNLIYKNYLFTIQEFMVLAAFAGIEEILLPGETQMETMGEGEMNMIVFQLYRKGILCWKGNGVFDLKPECRQLFVEIRACRKLLRIYSDRGKMVRLCFLSQDAVILEPSANDRNTVRLHQQTRSGFFRELCECRVLPEKDSRLPDSLFGEEEARGDCFRGLPELMQDGKIRYEEFERVFQENEWLSSCITIYDKTAGKDQGIIFLLDRGMFNVLAFLEEGVSLRADYYSMDGLKALIGS